MIFRERFVLWIILQSKECVQWQNQPKGGIKTFILISPLKTAARIVRAAEMILMGTASYWTGLNVKRVMTPRQMASLSEPSAF